MNLIQMKGPVNVLAQDGAVVFLRHGSRLIKAHACCVKPAKSTLPIIPENEKCVKNIDQVQEDKNFRSISESDSDTEIDNNNKSNQHHDNTTKISSLHQLHHHHHYEHHQKNKLQMLLMPSNRTRQYHYHRLHFMFQ